MNVTKHMLSEASGEFDPELVRRLDLSNRGSYIFRLSAEIQQNHRLKHETKTQGSRISPTYFSVRIWLIYQFKIIKY